MNEKTKVTTLKVKNIDYSNELKEFLNENEIKKIIHIDVIRYPEESNVKNLSGEKQMQLITQITVVYE